MTSITVEALGGIRFSASARGHQVLCDPSTESGVENIGMSPPELFLSALGCCVGVYVVRFCEKRSIPTEGMKIHVSSKSAEEPSRIGNILFEIEMPKAIPQELRGEVINAAKTCYLHNTLNNPPEMDFVLR